MNLPPYDKMKIRQENGKTMVLDILRRKYVRLTPEEMVRQCFVNFLVEYKGYPTALIGNEVQLIVGEKKLRCDSVLYDRDMQPRMIMEYKAPSYNTQLNVKYLMMSNGTQHVCLRYNDESGRWEFMPEIPNYKDL